MKARNNVVRKVFIILLCIGGIGLATFAYSVSQAFTHFVSSTLTRDSDCSVESAKILHLKNLMAPAPASAPVPVPSSPPPPPPPSPSPPPPPPSPSPPPSPPAPPRSPPPPPRDELDLVLAKAANPNRTVIMTALNWAWAEPNTMIDLFFEGFLVGEGTQELLNNLLVVSLDAKAYNRCLQIHPHCYSLKTRGVDFSAEKLFMSEDYLKMMWRRLGFLGEILKRGYSIVFSDADIMWLRNPFARLAEDADIQMTCDKYSGDPLDVLNDANTGFMYIRSNERTIRFYRDWYLSRRFFPGQKEQDVFNILKLTTGFAARGMKFMFLETKYFGGFCERSPGLDDVYTMHANCCKGLKAKLIDLRNVLDDWVDYRKANINTLSPNINTLSPNLGEWRPANACINSWWL